MQRIEYDNFTIHVPYWFSFHPFHDRWDGEEHARSHTMGSQIFSTAALLTWMCQLLWMSSVFQEMLFNCIRSGKSIFITLKCLTWGQNVLHGCKMCSSLTTLQRVSILYNIHYSIRQHYSCILLSFWFVLFTNKNVIGILCWFETSLFMTSVIVFTLSCCHTSVITEIARHNLVTFKGTTVGAWIGTLRQNRIVH